MNRILTTVIGVISILAFIIMAGYFSHLLIKIFMFGYHLIK